MCIPLEFHQELMSKTASCMNSVRGDLDTNFRLKLGFCPNKGETELTQSQLFKTTTIQNGDIVEFLSQYWGTFSKNIVLKIVCNAK